MTVVRKRSTETTGRKASREVRRRQLIDATIDVLARRGYADLTLADVADGAVWVAGDPPEGYVVARPQGADWLLENVAVVPGAKGKGLGGSLIRFAEAEGARRGFAKVVLYTNVNMVANLSMYPALGYTRIDQRTEHGLSRVYFEKSLAQ